MSRTIRTLVILIGLVLAASIAVRVQADSSRIDVLPIKGTINPVLVDYVSRGIDQADDEGALAVIIQLDTPGGLDTAMRDIIKEIVNARVPVSHWLPMLPLWHQIRPLVPLLQWRWAMMAKPRCRMK